MQAEYHQLQLLHLTCFWANRSFCCPPFEGLSSKDTALCYWQEEAWFGTRCHLNTGSRNVSDIFHEALLSWYHGFKIKRCFVCFLFLLTELNHMQSHAYIFNRNLCRTVSNSRHVANRPVLGFANGQSREMIWQLDWFLLVLFWEFRITFARYDMRILDMGIFVYVRILRRYNIYIYVLNIQSKGVICVAFSPQKISQRWAVGSPWKLAKLKQPSQWLGRQFFVKAWNSGTPRFFGYHTWIFQGMFLMEEKGCLYNIP